MSDMMILKNFAYQRNNYAIWGVVKDDVIVAKCYGGGGQYNSMTVALAIVEGEQHKEAPTNPSRGYSVSYVKVGTDAGSYAILLNEVTIAYVYGPNAQQSAELAVDELNRNGNFFADHFDRVQLYMVSPFNKNGI